VKKFIQFSNPDFQLEEKQFLTFLTDNTLHLDAFAENKSANPGFFVLKGEIAFTVLENKDADTTEIGFTFEKEFLVRRYTDYGEEYIARSTGYLSLKQINDVSIIIRSPIEINTSKILKDLLILPLLHGQDALAEFYCTEVYGEYNRISESIKECYFRDDKLIKEMAAGKILRKKNIKTGLAPVPTIQPNIIFLLPEFAPDNSTIPQRINYKEKSPFIEVKEGCLIARMQKGRAGVPGLDIFGKDIPVATLNEIVFSCGENIQIDETETHIEYKASLTGILEYSHRRISVQDLLRIKGNVDLTTGNINYSRNIIIDGNVTTDFAVACGGDLEIKGTIEDGARIKCDGNFTVLHGVIGKNTKVFCKKSAKVNFIQDANFVCEGDITVESFLYNASIFSKGFLSVEGKQSKTDKRGVVIGGIISAVKGMNLHSVGSIATKTRIITGVDIWSEKVRSTLQELFIAQNRKIAAIHNMLNINLEDPNSLQMIKILPDVRKKHIKSKLCELKKLILLQQDTKKQIDILDCQIQKCKTDNATITVQNYIIPDVLVTIGSVTNTIKKKSKNTTMSIQHEQFVEETGKIPLK